jgi:hypothetical protein
MSVLAEAVEVETAERERPKREALAEVERARRADERVTERELLTACRRAVDVACRALSHDEREDLTATLAEKVARKAGTDGAPDWTPPRRLIAHTYLTRRAAHLWARERERLIAGRADARPSTLDMARMPAALSLNVNGTLEAEEEDAPGHAPASILAAVATLAGHPAPAPENVDAGAVCAALGVSATAADAIRAALSGWGSALDLARALNVSHAVARKRLQRGRDAVRRAYPDPAALLAALGDALADAPDPERIAERVRLSAAERAAADAVTAVARSGRAYSRRTDPAVTLRATRRNWRGYMRPSGAGISALATLRGHVARVSGTGAPMATWQETPSVATPAGPTRDP